MSMSHRPMKRPSLFPNAFQRVMRQSKRRWPTAVAVVVLSVLLATAVADCIQKGSIACSNPLVLFSPSASACQELCNSLEYCVLFTYTLETRQCSLCPTSGVRMTTDASFFGPAKCTPSTVKRECVATTCTVNAALDPSLVSGNSSRVVEKQTALACQQACQADNDCVFTEYNGMNCTLVTRAFRYPQDGKGMTFGLSAGAILIGKTCTKTISTSCIRQGTAFLPNSGSESKTLRVVATKDIATCAQALKTSALKAFSYFQPAFLCLLAEDRNTFDEQGNTTHLTLDPFGSALTRQSVCLAEDATLSSKTEWDIEPCDVMDAECFENRQIQCDAYDMTSVTSAQECALICRDLIACDSFHYIPNSQLCRICWNVYLSRPADVNEVYGRRDCLLSVAPWPPLVKPPPCCPHGLPPWCASPFSFFHRPHAIGRLLNRSPVECYTTCNRMKRCSFATYTGSVCEIHEDIDNVGGVYTDDSADILVIPKRCRLEFPDIRGVRLTIPSQDPEHYLRTTSMEECRDLAVASSRWFSYAYQSILYWPALGLCVLSSEEAEPNRIKVTHAGVFLAPIHDGFPFWLIGELHSRSRRAGRRVVLLFRLVLIVGVSLIVIVAIVVFVYRHYRRSRQRRRATQIERSLKHGSWLRSETICAPHTAGETRQRRRSSIQSSTHRTDSFLSEMYGKSRPPSLSQADDRGRRLYFTSYTEDVRDAVQDTAVHRRRSSGRSTTSPTTELTYRLSEISFSPRLDEETSHADEETRQDGGVEHPSAHM